MGSVNRKELYNKTIGEVTDDFDEQSGSFPNGIRSAENNEVDYVALLKVSDYSAGDIDGVVEHSHDGTYWTTVATFDTLSAAGISLKDITADLLPKVRAKMTKTIASTATVQVDLYYRRSK